VPPALISLSVLGQFQPLPLSSASSSAAFATISGSTTNAAASHSHPSSSLAAAAAAKPSGLMSALSRAAHSTAAASHSGASTMQNAATDVSMRALYEQDSNTVGWLISTTFLIDAKAKQPNAGLFSLGFPSFIFVF
jgi:hypothetical protein